MKERLHSSIAVTSLLSQGVSPWFSTNLNPKDTVLDDIDEEIVNLEASVHKIDEHYQQQDVMQQLAGDEPLLDAKAEEEYKDQYAVMQQENDGETLRLKDETSKLLWHQRLHTSLDTMLATKTRIIKLSDQVSRNAIAVLEDIIREPQPALVLADKSQIKQAASTISEREKLIEDAEARLWDQAEALTVKFTSIDAKLTTTQNLLTNLEEQTEKGDVIIRTIISLKSTEKIVQSAFSCMRKYADSLQHGIAAPPQTLTATKDLKEIRNKLDKMKQFASRSINEVRKASEQ